MGTGWTPTTRGGILSCGLPMLGPGPETWAEIVAVTPRSKHPETREEGLEGDRNAARRRHEHGIDEQR